MKQTFFIACNDILLAKMYDVEKHYNAIMNIVAFIDSLSENEQVVYKYGNPCLEKVSEKIHQLHESSKTDETAKIEFHYLYDLETEIALCFLSNEEKENWNNMCIVEM